MILRPLLLLLLAMAMLVAPIGVQGGAAMAMTPGGEHHQAISDAGHCDEQPASGQQEVADEQSCCAAMCTAVAVDPPTPTEPPALPPEAGRPASDRFRHGFLARLPTPPPRLS